MRLSAAFEEARGANAHIEVYGPLDVRLYGLVSPGCRAVIDRWSWAIVIHWRQSPTVIYECGTCGEIRLGVGKKKRKCSLATALRRSGPKGVAKAVKCGGDLLALEPPYDRNRPRRKKIKL